MANWFNLNGALLRIDAEDPALVKPLLIYLDELSIQSSERTPDFRLVLERGLPQPPPPEAKFLYGRRWPEGLDCQYSALRTRRFLLVPEQLSLEYSTQDGIAKMRAAPGHERFIGATAGIYAIYAALFATRQTLIHAAALRLPQEDAAFVLFAPSGAGKTTTSLALALQGFALLTDDATVLSERNAATAGTEVWGLPRPPKVHRRTGELLPSIGRLLGPEWNAEDEQGVTLNALRSQMEVLPGRAYPLTGLILLGDRTQGAHRLRPMRKSDLFVHFVRDNLSCTQNGLMEDDLARYNAFVRAVASTPAYELNVGSDLSTLGEVIAAALSRADQAILSA